jgi:hypothetical protein
MARANQVCPSLVTTLLYHLSSRQLGDRQEYELDTRSEPPSPKLMTDAETTSERSSTRGMELISDHVSLLLCLIGTLNSRTVQK